MRFILTMALALAASVVPALASQSPPSATKAPPTVIHDGDVIVCPVNLVCDIVFSAVESLDGKPRHGGDPKDWDIVADHGPPSQIAIRPLRVGAFTDVVMPTTDGVYLVYVRAVAPTTEPVPDAFTLEFAPRPSPPPRVVVIEAPAPSTPPPPPSILAFVDRASLHCDAADATHPTVYRVTGSAPFRPIQVCVDALKTYIQLPPNVDLPAFAEVGPRGELDFIEPNFEDNVFIDVAHRAHYVLVLGSGRSAQHVYINRVPGSIIAGSP